LTVDLLKSSVIGQKDVSNTVFHIWDEIFHPNSKKALFKQRLENQFSILTHGTAQRSADSSNTYSSFHTLSELVQSYGNFDKIVEGIYVHYLQMKYLDNLMTKTSQMANWIAWCSDVADRFKNYVPAGIYFISKTIAQNHEPNLTFPTLFSDVIFPQILSFFF